MKLDLLTEDILIDRIDFFIRYFFRKGQKAVIGVSGGKDSSVCLTLLTRALGKYRVVPVIIPNGEMKDITDALEICKWNGFEKNEVLVINIEDAYKSIVGQLRGSVINDVFATNTPARLRMTVLYGVAALVNGFVCNTCNRSEDYVGYSTKYGDSCGDFSLLNNLTVTQVVKLADYLNIPIELGHKTPDDGMSGVSDETKLGFTYAELDKFLTDGVKGPNYERIKALHENPNTKLKLLPMYNPFGAVLSETTIEEE